MKETRFIAQNKEKWLESENLLSDTHKDPEKLSNLFTQVVDDLSYSRTYYQNRSVRVYLNKIAREYFSIIYSNQKEKHSRFKLFWLDELPQIMIFSRRPMLISLFVFLLSMAIGVFSSVKDPQFTSTIMGDSYVTMTKANIEKGDPMAVYKEGHQVNMFLGITFNNLMVAFRTYVFGIFLSIGTLALLLYNGIMVGCFQYFFVERGLFAESALTIWLHGTLEISSIILAGGAGLTLGSGLLFPGTYSRLQAFQLSAMRSLKLMLGITPTFIVAAVIESFLTRYTETPDILRLLLIMLSAAFIIGYFVVYPWLKSKKGFKVPLEEVRLPASNNDPVHYNRIKNNTELLKDTFLFYKRNSGQILSWVLVVTAGLSVADILLSDDGLQVRYSTEWWTYFFSDILYALQTDTSQILLVKAVGISIILCRIHFLLMKEKDKSSSFTVLAAIQTLIVGAIIFGLVYLGGWGILLLILSFAILLLLSFTQHAEKINIFSAFGRAWTLSMANFGQVMGLQLILVLMSFSFMLVLSAPLIYMYTSILQWNFAKDDVWSQNIVHFIELFAKYLGFNLILPILTISTAYLYFSLNEVLSAESLKTSIAQIGAKLSRARQ